MRQALQFIEKFKEINVLVVGDVMIDKYSFGETHRLSPEAPVPVVEINKRESRLGGAANVATNIRSLGATPILCSVVDDGTQANEVRSLLNSQGIDSANVLKSKDRRTTIKHRIIAGDKQVLRVDTEDTHPLSKEDVARLFQTIERHVGDANVIVLADYDKGVLTEKTVSEILYLARKNDIPVAVDPKENSFSFYRGVALFKPNLRELSKGLSVDINADDENALKDSVETVKNKQDLDNVLLTLADRGMYVDFMEEQYFIPAETKSVSDVSGAGDTVISVASLMLAAGADAKILGQVANIAGGIACSKPGVVAVTADELVERTKEKYK